MKAVMEMQPRSSSGVGELRGVTRSHCLKATLHCDPPSLKSLSKECQFPNSSTLLIAMTAGVGTALWSPNRTPGSGRHHRTEAHTGTDSVRPPGTKRPTAAAAAPQAGPGAPPGEAGPQIEALRSQASSLPDLGMHKESQGCIPRPGHCSSPKARRLQVAQRRSVSRPRWNGRSSLEEQLVFLQGPLDSLKAAEPLRKEAKGRRARLNHPQILQPTRSSQPSVPVRLRHVAKWTARLGQPSKILRALPRIPLAFSKRRRSRDGGSCRHVALVLRGSKQER